MLTTRSLFACAGLLAALSSSAFAGPDWIERGDAGSDVSTGQEVVGEGPLTRISGRLAPPTGPDRTPADYEDLYIVRITSPATFFFEVTGGDFNMQLFLFNITQPGEALGLLANDDRSLTDNRPLLSSPANDGTAAQVIFPGTYALAVSGFGRYPVALGPIPPGGLQPIFFFANTKEISGPDGPAGINALMGWAGEGQTGSYDIMVQGIDFVRVPAPGSAALLVLSLGIAGRRRRS